MTQAGELYACLYAREFPAQALLRLRPELRGGACVVMENDPPLEQVCSLNRKALALGLARGMARAEVETFPAVVVLRRCSGEEAAARLALLECAGAFSPRVEDRSRDGAFLCVMDIAGTGKLFGPPEALARNLLAHVRSLGITACVAVSGNFHAAIALAKGLAPGVAVKVISAGEEAAALASLPLQVLELSEDQSEKFALWGIRTLGMLAALPEKGLVARLGQAGKRLRQAAQGELPHLFQPIEPAFTLEEKFELDSPVELLDPLLFVVGVMIEQLVLRAEARMLALASVEITLALEGGAEFRRAVRPALPSNDKRLWIKLIHLDLEAHPPGAAILGLTLKAEPGQASKAQLGLFSPQLPEPSRLDVTLARIRAIVGEGNAGRIVLRDTHGPDSFRMEPFRAPSMRSPETAPVRPRPAMRCLRPAEAISVTTEQERPRAFVFRERRYAVEQAYGPWYSDGDWWAQTLWGHEEWDMAARARDGALLCCCLMRDRMRNEWRMLALYD